MTPQTPTEHMDSPTPATGAEQAPGAGIPTLEVEHVTMKFGGVTALDDVSFTVRPGTIHAVIGPNGAGKSTCFNVVSGLYTATSGRVMFGTDDLTGLPSHIARPPRHRSGLPERRPVRPRDRHRQRHARSPQPDLRRLPQRRLPAAADAQGAGPAHRPGARDLPLPEPRRRPAPPGRRAVLRRPEARRRGARPGHRAHAADAGRAGGRHERPRDLGDGPHDHRRTRRARHLGAPRRARHVPGDGDRRPRHRPRLRQADRRRTTEAGAQRPRGDPRLPRRCGGRQPVRRRGRRRGRGQGPAAESAAGSHDKKETDR